MDAMVFQQLISTGPAELLISSIWQGLLLTSSAWAVLKLAARLRASTRFTVWLIVFTLVALLPVFSLGRSLWTAEWARATATLLPNAPVALHLNAAWAFAIEAIWAMASTWFLVRLVMSVAQMIRLYRTSTPVEPLDLNPEFQSIVARPGTHAVQIRLSGRLDTPSVIGFFKPAIVVPHNLWKELAPEDMEQVLRHEMAHLERGDDWTNLLQKLLRALCPLNPALLWAEKHLCREREQACDDAVLDAAGNARAYALCLTRLAESRLVKRAALLAPGLWKRHSELSARIDNILHRRRGLHPLFSRGLVTASLALSLSGVLVLQLCPSLVTFTASSASSQDRASEHVPFADGHAVRAYQAAYHGQANAGYRDAVFHPQVHNGLLPSPAIAPAVHKGPPRKSVRARTHTVRPQTSPSLRLVEFNSADQRDEQSAGVAWIVFTVEVSSDVSYRDTVLTGLPNLTNSDNWIFFQI